MAYTAPKKKKTLWDNILDTLGGAADAVIPGDQSKWRSGATNEENTSKIIAQPQATPVITKTPSTILDFDIPKTGSIFGTPKQESPFTVKQPSSIFDKPTPQATPIVTIPKVVAPQTPQFTKPTSVLQIKKPTVVQPTFTQPLTTDQKISNVVATQVKPMSYSKKLRTDGGTDFYQDTKKVTIDDYVKGTGEDRQKVGAEAQKNQFEHALETPQADGVKLADTPLSFADSKSINQFREEYRKTNVDGQRALISRFQEAARATEGYGDEDELKRNQYGLIVAALNNEAKKEGNLGTLVADFGGGINDSFRNTGETMGKGFAMATGETEKAAQAQNASADETQAIATSLYKSGKITREQFAKEIADADVMRRTAQRMLQRQIEDTDPIKMAGAVANAVALPISFAAGAGTTGAAVKLGVTGSLTRKGIGDVTAATIKGIAPKLSSRMANTAGLATENILSGAPNAATEVAMNKGADATWNDYLTAQGLNAVGSAALPVAGAVTGTVLRGAGNVVSKGISNAQDIANMSPLERQRYTEQGHVGKTVVRNEVDDALDTALETVTPQRTFDDILAEADKTTDPIRLAQLNDEFDSLSGTPPKSNPFDNPNFGRDKTATLAIRDRERAKVLDAQAQNEVIPEIPVIEPPKPLQPLANTTPTRPSQWMRDAEGNTFDPATGEIKYSDEPTPDKTTQKTEPYTYRDEEGTLITGFKNVDEAPKGTVENPYKNEAEARAAASDERNKQTVSDFITGRDKINPLDVNTGSRTVSIKPPEMPSRLGTIAQDFYESKKGNNAIKFRNLERLGEQVTEQIDTAYKALGTDFKTVASKVEEARRNGVKTVDGLLSPDEAIVWRQLQSEMDYVRRRASVGRREISGGDFGEMYVPNISKERLVTPATLFDDFRQSKPGSENKRTGKMNLDDLNYSSSIVGDYVTRYGDTKLLQEDRIIRALERNNPDVDPSKISKAAAKVISLQHTLNKQIVKITALGRKVTTTDGKVINVTNELNQVGKELGHDQINVTDTPHGLTNGKRINSVDVVYKGQVHKIADFVGLNQIHDAGAYAGTHTIKAAGNRQVLADLVAERLNNAYQLTQGDVDYAVQSVLHLKEGMPENVVRGHIENLYKNAGKQQMMENLQHVTIHNKTLSKDVSDLAKQVLREGSTEQALSAKIVRKTLQGTNALFRKANISSALNEMSDLASFATIYGTKLRVVTPDFSLIKKYGVGEIDAALEPYLKQSVDDAGKKGVLQFFKSVNDGTNFYKYVETYKAGVFLKSAEDFYTAKGLSGDALTERVLQDYRDFALPVDMFTKTVLDNIPLFTQYLSWGARNMEKEGKLLLGQFDAGVMKDKTIAQRIARDMYANLPAKTVFWLASNGLKGTAITTAIGLTDFTGLTNQDYSGIAEEDKSWFDKTTQFTNISTIASLANVTIQAWEKEQLKNSDKYKNADYNPYEHANLTDTVIKTYTPQVVKNMFGSYSTEKGGMVGGAKDLMDKGYSESADSRIQYEAPTDAYNIGKAFAFGKNQTANAREYSGRKNLVDRVNDGTNPLVAVKDMAAEQFSLKETDYNRPLTEDYSKKYKAVEKSARTELLKGGRAYNDYLDNLKKDSPDLYNSYITAMDGNHVSPEYWRNISHGTEGEPDLTTFHMMRDRKKQLEKSPEQGGLAKAYDPLYDLPDDQAAQVLQYKSTATGDDIALRNTMNKQQWYKDLKDRQKAFYKANPLDSTDEKFTTTERVKQWDALDDKLTSYFFDPETIAKEGDPVWAKDYPLVYQQKAINETYGFESVESKAFFKTNGDDYKAEKEGYDKAQLVVINQMRKIEGFPEMSWEAYQQATKIADTDKSDDKSYAKSSSSDISSNAGGSYSHIGASGAAKSISVKAPKVAIKKKELKKITIKRSKM